MPTNCLSVFDHFVGLALKGLTEFEPKYQSYTNLYTTTKVMRKLSTIVVFPGGIEMEHLLNMGYGITKKKLIYFLKKVLIRLRILFQTEYFIAFL